MKHYAKIELAIDSEAGRDELARLLAAAIEHSSMVEAMTTALDPGGALGTEVTVTGFEVIPPEPMRLRQVIETAKALGFESVSTTAGPIPLDEWSPYGSIDGAGWSGKWTGPNEVTDVVEDTPDPMVPVGVWKFL